MFDDRIKNYIKEQLKRGYSSDQIKDVLVRAGHDKEKINNYIKELNPRYTNAYIPIIFGSSLLIILIFYLFYWGIPDINNKIEKHVQMGNSLCSQGKYSEALEEFDKAINLNKTKPRGYYFKGKCYTLRGEHEEAILILNKAIQLNTKNPNYYYYLGLNYCAENNFISGIPFLQKAVDLNETNQKFFDALGKCYLQSGDIENSLYWFNKSLFLQK